MSFRVTQFCLGFCFCSRAPSRILQGIQLSRLFRLLLVVTVLQNLLVLKTLTVLQIIGQVFCRMLPCWNLCFSNDEIGTMGFQEDHRGKMPFSSHYINKTYYPHDLLLWTLILIPWLRQCLSDFSTVKSLAPVSLLYSLKGNHHLQPKLRGQTASPFLQDRESYKLSVILLHGKFVSSFPYVYLFSYLSISIQIHGYVF